VHGPGNTPTLSAITLGTRRSEGIFEEPDRHGSPYNNNNKSDALDST